MKQSLLSRLDGLAERFEELGALLADPDIIGDQKRFRALSKEYAELEEVVLCYRQFRAIDNELQQARSLLDEQDADLRELAQQEIADATSRLQAQQKSLEVLLLPKDPDDRSNVFLEIRAGTGGDEAALFAGDLFRMYSRYAESCRWQVEVVSASEGEHGGFREIISRIVGESVYARLKFESGAHRVQRVPDTESQGRIHTSACTIAVMAEPDEQTEINIKKDDLRIDTYRSSGAGGQHVNTTDSAIRITHLPTGVVVECQDERSQHKNKAKAMALLQARLNAAQQDAQAQAISDTRKKLVGSGDRSERIRTYNFPQGRLTDHRINLTLYKLADIMQGDLTSVINPLVHEYQTEQLTQLGQG